MAFICKRGYFCPTFHIFYSPGKSYTNPFSTYLTHIILLTLLTFFALPILKKKIRIYQVWFLFGVSPSVDSYSRHFGTINNNKMVSKI